MSTKRIGRTAIYNVPEDTITGESSGVTERDLTTTAVGNKPASTSSITSVESIKSIKSVRSGKAARIARAREELLQLQVKLAAARLATLELEEINSEEDHSDREPEEDATRHVENWMHHAHLSGAAPSTTAPATLPVAAALQNNAALPPAPEASTLQPETKPLQTPPSSTHVNLSELASAIAAAARSGPQQARLTELPSYGGSHQDWLSFRAAYEETVKSYTELENIGRLRRALRGRAKEAVENLLIYNASPEEIMKSLEARFGRPDSIALAELDRLRALPRLNDAPRDICIFASRVANIVATLRALRKLHYLYNPEATKITIEKLTPVLRYRWYDFAAEQQNEEPDLEKLSRFLSRESERCGPYAQPESLFSDQPAPAQRRQKMYNTTERRIEKCAACSDEGHRIEDCKKFKETTVNDRWDIAKNRKLCFSCLRFRTRTHRCRRKRCEIENCQYWHHRLLHHKKQEHREIQEKGREIEHVASTWARGPTSYIKIVPVHISGPGGEIETYALLDDGSTVTLIDEEISKKAGVTGPHEPLHIEVIGDHRMKSSSRRVNISLRGPSQETFKIQARTMSNLKLSPQAITERDLADCEHLSDIRRDLQYDGAKPRILIGQDNWHLLLASEVRRGQKHQPVASLTPLGWVLHGARSRPALRKQQERVNFINEQSNNENMDEQLRDYFALESLFIQEKLPKNNPEHRALEKLENEVRQIDERYEAPLLWKRDDDILPNNYENTLKRLHSIERKLDRNENLKKKYTEYMNGLIEKGYAERAPIEKNIKKTWYLPHFAVINPMKPDKLRVVHDAAAKTSGVSLNDHLLKGPDLIQSLPGVLMRFRQKRVAVTADIKEMFMQVKVKPEDRDALRYLWRGEDRGDTVPQEFRMTSLIFGATCSPAIAIYVKNYNALKHKETDPQACDAIIRNHYVDDLLNSYDSEEEAISSARRISEIHKKAHYELRQWNSNSKKVANELSTIETRSVINLDIESSPERVLGVVWTPRTDDLGFNLNMARLPADIMVNEKPTKRETLRVLMSLFDPLGLASPVTIKAKQILQEIWRRGTEWDQAIDDDLSLQWIEWLEHLKKLSDIRIPRCYHRYSDASLLQLHIFVDASETAYSAIAYWRATTDDGRAHVSLIAAKAKVCPLKLTSIPRLELQAAVMGSRMGRTIVEEHDVKPASVTYWTDSKTVITWLKTGSRSYRPFVAHRIAAIEENSSLADWRWVPTKHNVADDATRDVPLDFNSDHRWFQGPAFLCEDSSTWPTERPSLEIPTGEEKVHHARVNEISLHSVIPDPTRFSKWERLQRIIARVLQFIDLCRLSHKTYYRRLKKNEESDPDWRTKTTNKVKTRKKIVNVNNIYIPIGGEHMKRAEQLLVRVIQQDSFEAEICDISCARKGRLRALSVQLSGGLIRIKSRIQAADNILEEQRNPVVLDGDHHITRLYIEYVHRKLHHAGVEATMNECRSRYWITRLRPITRQIVHRCLLCQARKKLPPEPPTGDLPHCRLAHHQRPFTYTGLDYFGPITVTVGRSIQKRYVALFTCLTTRAVHLEVAPSLTTESAVMALRRFIARRGCPTELWSDNGSNLRAAEKDLRRAIDAATQHEASSRAINWRFIPPGAPFMGGAWERMVRAVKTALYATLNERHPSDEVLATLLAEVEFTVNNRPLTHVSVDPEDPEALTPNHFLLLGPALNPAPGSFDDGDLLSRRHWRTSQRLADMFWGRWIKEYLPDLQQRRDPHGRGEHIRVGDIVMIADNTLPRNTWPKGRVTKTFPGGDGVVRTVDIQTKGRVLRRPVKKLIIIARRDLPPTVVE